MRATVEHQENRPSLTPVEATVVLGKEDLTIKVTAPCFCWRFYLERGVKGSIMTWGISWGKSQSHETCALWLWREERPLSVDRCPLLGKCSADLFVCLFQISDRGGGVPLRITDRLFSYTYSTAPTPVMDNSRNAPLVRPMIQLNLSQNHLIVT